MSFIRYALIATLATLGMGCACAGLAPRAQCSATRMGPRPAMEPA